MTSYPRSILVWTISLAIAGLWSVPGRAATVSSNPVADAFVTPGSDGSLSGNNYGGAGIMGVAGPGKPQGEFQSVLRFDLASTKTAFDLQFGAGQWTIQSVTLQLTAAPANNAILNAPSAGNFAISWMQNDSWTEGTGTPTSPTTTGITWNTLPGFLGASDEALGTFAFNGASSGSTSYTLNLTSGFSLDLSGGNLASLRILSADSNVSYLFNTRNFGTVASRPVLNVTAVPEPGSIALSLIGFSLLIGLKLRRRG